MRTLLVVAATLFAVTTTASADQVCERLSISEGHALTRKQLEGRICTCADMVSALTQAQRALPDNHDLDKQRAGLQILLMAREYQDRGRAADVALWERFGQAATCKKNVTVVSRLQ